MNAIESVRMASWHRVPARPASAQTADVIFGAAQVTTHPRQAQGKVPLVSVTVHPGCTAAPRLAGLSLPATHTDLV